MNSTEANDIQVHLDNLHIENEEDLIAKHKRERKVLQCKIQALKKSAGKGDKKKKKEVAEQIIQLEHDLDKLHSVELNQFRKQNKIQIDDGDDDPPQSSTTKVNVTSRDQTNETNNDDDDDDALNDEIQQGRISKAQKRRDRKAIAERERQAEIAIQEELNKNGPRMLETRQINKLLKERQLRLFPIKSDGDCLYAAINHQLEETDRPKMDIKTLRSVTADYIESNKEQLICYMTNMNTGECLSDIEFQKYCDDLRNTSAWGGQIEIKALSNALQTTIEVIQANGPPTIQIPDNPSTTLTTTTAYYSHLIITYHRLLYSLGEHYNSTTTKSPDEDDDDENKSEGREN